MLPLSIALITTEGVTALLEGKQPRLVRHEEKHTEHEQKAVVGPRGAVKTLFKSQAEESDFCDEAFVYGSYGTSDCGTDAAVSPIEREELCSDAADVMHLSRGKPAEGMPFEVNLNYYDVYPRGCFKKDGEDTLWFNPFGALPANPAGDSKPVCHRPKYVLGTNDTNDGGFSADDDYGRLLDEDECRTFAECLGHCSPEEFRVGVNASWPSHDERPASSGLAWYDKRPKGCFINPDDNCVYFNVPQDAEPTEPVGAPVCKIVAHGVHAEGTVTNATGNATGGAANATTGR